MLVSWGGLLTSFSVDMSPALSSQFRLCFVQCDREEATVCYCGHSRRFSFPHGWYKASSPVGDQMPCSCFSGQTHGELGPLPSEDTLLNPRPHSLAFHLGSLTCCSPSRTCYYLWALYWGLCGVVGVGGVISSVVFVYRKNEIKMLKVFLKTDIRAEKEVEKHGGRSHWGEVSTGLRYTRELQIAGL